MTRYRAHLISRTELVLGMMAIPKGRDYLKRLDSYMEGHAA